MTDITIPAEALKAFLREVEAHDENISGEAARTACLAMLRSWPGMWEEEGDDEWGLYLPLPKEPSDDN